MERQAQLWVELLQNPQFPAAVDRPEPVIHPQLSEDKNPENQPKT